MRAQSVITRFMIERTKLASLHKLTSFWCPPILFPIESAIFFFFDESIERAFEAYPAFCLHEIDYMHLDEGIK